MLSRRVEGVLVVSLVSVVAVARAAGHRLPMEGTGCCYAGGGRALCPSRLHRMDK